jgi:hypothetical protein
MKKYMPAKVAFKKQVKECFLGHNPLPALNRGIKELHEENIKMQIVLRKNHKSVNKGHIRVNKQSLYAAFINKKCPVFTTGHSLFYLISN